MSDGAGSVLVYSMGEVIGDGLIKLPVIGALREAFPKARLSWCAASGRTVYAGPLAPVVEGVLDEIVTDPPTGAGPWDWLTARRPFDGRRWEVVIDTQNNLRRSLVARRAAERLFVSGAGGGGLSQRRLQSPLPEPVVPRLTALIGLAAGRPIEPRPLPLAHERALAAAETLLPRGPTYVAFAPGAGGANKRWPFERFVELAAGQAERGRTPVFLIGPQEPELAALVRARLPGALLPEADRTDPFGDVGGPLLVIAMAGRLAGAVANDAGPGHMLAAGGAPLLSLQLDRRRAFKFRPAARRLEMLVAEEAGPGGMSAIAVSAADAALERLLEAA
ncbi:MAG: lipopolysaccharide heptosyltransferase family protein [Pseudomonadota bacterium]|nr:lipopolysaccharide heptosyltransferase family protein [Pseudomonadota bacterium]